MSDGEFAVQARWRVGDDEHSYRPVVVSTLAEARQTANEMAATLSHFVDLEIVIEPTDPCGGATS